MNAGGPPLLRLTGVLVDSIVSSHDVRQLCSNLQTLFSEAAVAPHELGA